MDDDKEIRLLGRDILSYFGYNVITAKDGEEAIQQYKSAKQKKEPNV